MTALLEAEFGNIEVTFGRCRYVDNVWSDLTQEFSQIGEVLFDREPFVELLGHQRLAVTHANDLTSFNPLDLRSVGISDLAASHNSNLKHADHPARNFGNNAAVPPQWALFASSQAWPSISHCYTVSSSSQ